MLYKIDSGFPTGVTFFVEDESQPSNPVLGYVDVITKAQELLGLGIPPTSTLDALEQLVVAGYKITFSPDRLERQVLLES